MSCAGGCGFTIDKDTTLGTLLSEYPAVESALRDLASSLSALDNPLTRKFLLESVTLGNLADGEGVPLETVIGRVRHAAGLAPEALGGGAGDRPEWARDGNAAVTLDAREMLARGEHPLSAVLQGTSDLPPGGVFLLVAPFLPSPLIERVTARGFEAFSVEEEPGCVKNFFRRI